MKLEIIPIWKEDDAKAYLVTMSIQTKVLAKDEDEAEDNAIDKVSNDPGAYIMHGNIEDIQIDEEVSYDKRLEEQCD